MMAPQTKTQPVRDTLKVEKVSLLILTLCILVLVWVVVAKPF